MIAADVEGADQPKNWTPSYSVTSQGPGSVSSDRPEPPLTPRSESRIIAPGFGTSLSAASLDTISRSSSRSSLKDMDHLEGFTIASALGSLIPSFAVDKMAISSNSDVIFDDDSSKPSTPHQNSSFILEQDVASTGENNLPFVFPTPASQPTNLPRAIVKK